ncbi:hypothetical protein [Spiroplasma endosymbiont of Polydrusus pterygomalis]|uniref:hypothetical protein n=1 Tax=Spiroplasma endosymbiont of Polydrusus pterygomalis TaxID=3139327 RepID=UPI003CCB525C
MINSSIEQSTNEITPLLQKNVTYINYWQNFIFKFMPTRESILNLGPTRKDVFCCGATTLSILSFSTIGLYLGSLCWAIKNNIAVDIENINRINGACFLLGIMLGLRYGINIGDYFLNLISSNNEENENSLISNNDISKILQEVTIITEDGSQFLISENITETNWLANGLVKIHQTFKVENKKNDEQQFQDEINNKGEFLNVNTTQSSNFVDIETEIHNYDFYNQPSTSKSSTIINL